MKRYALFSFCILISLFFVSCDDDKIEIEEDAEMVLLSEHTIAVSNREVFTLTFTSSSPWKIKCSTLVDGKKKGKPDWFEVEKTEGEAGQNIIRVEVKKLNNDKYDRTGMIEISGSGSSKLSANIFQRISPLNKNLVKKIIKYDNAGNEIGNVKYTYHFEKLLFGGDSTIVEIENSRNDFSETMIIPHDRLILYKSFSSGSMLKDADIYLEFLKNRFSDSYRMRIREADNEKHLEKVLTYDATGQLIQIKRFHYSHPLNEDELNFRWGLRFDGLLSLSDENATVLYEFSNSRFNNLNIDLSALIIYLFTTVDEPVLLLDCTGKRNPSLPIAIKDHRSGTTITIEYAVDRDGSIPQVRFTDQSGLYEVWKIEYL